MAENDPTNDMPSSDMMATMFSMQKDLNAHIGVNTDSMDEQEQVRWILNYTRAMSQELAELTDSVPWKWWAKYQTYDKQNARVEVVDLFHFLISLAQTLGMTAEDVYGLYMKKNELNWKRQKTGYIEKDDSDNRAL
jgi:dimeric dUTPase (all-alpha-NTP-PPase superfamily)